MSFDQGQFDFDTPGSDAGWRRWREELERQQQEFETRWGVRLGKRVIVTLKDHAKPISGRMEWIDHGKTVKPGVPPRFRMRGLEFGHEEIESIVEEDA